MPSKMRLKLARCSRYLARCIMSYGRDGPGRVVIVAVGLTLV